MNQPVANEAQELWYKASIDEWMHRCADCWQSQRHAHKGGVPIAVNNGWYPTTQTYPHAAWCKQRGKF